MHNFINEMREMLGTHNDTVILDWIHYIGELSDQCDTNPREELNDILRSFWYVKNKFDAEVLQKSLRLYVLPNEIINGAMQFEKGLSVEEIRQMAEDGKLECGFIPDKYYGKDGYEREEEETNDMITAEDIVEQAVYAVNAPECCTEDHAENMLSMLGSNIVGEDIYHDEDECPKLEVGGMQ